MKTIEGQLASGGRTFGLVAARFNSRIVDLLVGGATDCFLRHGSTEEDLSLVRVPGAWEIPLALHELAKTGIGLLVQRVEAYRIETDSWPDASTGLAALTDGQATPSASYYVKPDQIIDPWGGRYTIIVPGPDAHPYEIVSYGADGQPGGDGENADLSSINLRRSE